MTGFGGPSSPVCEELGEGLSPVALSPRWLSARFLSCRSRGVASGRFRGRGGGDAASISAQSAWASDMYGSLTQALAPAAFENSAMEVTLRTEAIGSFWMGWLQGMPKYREARRTGCGHNQVEEGVFCSFCCGAVSYSTLV